MKNIYIVSDVHGCYKSLLALIEQFPNKQNSKIVFVGDLVDRGKNSYDVVKFVMENKYDCVKGNHEEMLLEYGPTKEELYFNDESKHWLYSCGGDETLTSYNNKKEEYYKHYDFLNSLPLYIEYQDYKTKDNRYLVVSHSTISGVWELKDSSDTIDKDIFESHILWSRKSSKDIKEIFNVYGHTIFEEPKINQFSCGIDLGCCYKKNPSKIQNPRLCALEFPSMKLFIQENIED
ncbi:metallophosphoesterase family protein [Aliarcobacter cryaerophilus]|uniref:Metallophosphoesterase family protein n=1 Tax=Arcobacter sp. AZ-2023 TaxID=3074453 RepID=A0AA96DLT8_9BACT|nr:metallophosphoesterase family protein [Arcobacter sp. AZ-2023]